MSETDAAELLTAAMKKRGWSAPEVARRTGGQVSGSSVLAYQNNQTKPTPSSALAVARAFEHEEAIDMLVAWGYSEMAAALEEARDRRIIRPHDPGAAYEYTVEDQGAGVRRVPIGWRTEIEIVAIVENSLGVEWIARTESGTLIAIRPYYSIEVSEELAKEFRPNGDE